MKEKTKVNRTTTYLLFASDKDAGEAFLICLTPIALLILAAIIFG